VVFEGAAHVSLDQYDLELCKKTLFEFLTIPSNITKP
jgi:hypothetical protein